MTDLTEQWKKGELPKGEEYWVILTNEWYLQNPVKPVRAFYSCDCEFEGYLDDDIKEVLAPVPSYEEWQTLINLYKEADVIIKKSDKENDKLKTDCCTLAQKLLQVKPELREWLEVNYKEYL